MLEVLIAQVVAAFGFLIGLFAAWGMFGLMMMWVLGW